jgi:hypothetical protein
MREEGGGRKDMAVAKARNKEYNNQPSMEVVKARWGTMEQAEDATINQLCQRQAAAGNESKRTAASNGQQKGAGAVDKRVNNCTTKAIANKYRRQ